MDSNLAYCCIHCGSETKELYHSYSPTVLKISECDKCNRPADEYIECDLALVLLDLFLQKLPAYRHVLCNGALKNAWRLLLIFILCDAYYNWVEANASSDGRRSVDIYDLEWHFYVNILQVSIETAITILITAAFCLWSSRNRSVQSLNVIVNKLQIGFYGNVLVLFAVVWEQHQSTSFIVLTRLFLFVSHVQVLRALTNVGFPKAASIVFLAMGTGKAARYFSAWVIK